MLGLSIILLLLEVVNAQTTSGSEHIIFVRRNLSSNEAGTDPAAFAVLAAIFCFVAFAYAVNTYCGRQHDDPDAQEAVDDATVGGPSRRAFTRAKAELGTGLLKFDEEHTFDRHVRDVSYVIRKAANNADTHQKIESPPGPGVYRGGESLVLELHFQSVPNGSGFEVSGIGQDSTHDIDVSSGFLSKIGEMYWVESRIKRGESGKDIENPSTTIESRTCIRGRYNFTSQEFRGWFETDGGVNGRCLLFASQDSSWLLNGLKTRNSKRELLAEKNVQDHKRRSSAFTIITSNKRQDSMKDKESTLPASFLPIGDESSPKACEGSIV